VADEILNMVYVVIMDAQIDEDHESAESSLMLFTLLSIQMSYPYF
jgi:hypothetical protein